jgi:dimethylargininase
MFSLLLRARNLMPNTFTRAILRRPAPNFASGETSVDLGEPIFSKVEQQYQAYCDALQHCRLGLTILEADADYPDSTFVEDAAVLTRSSAIFTRPGAESRAGEVTRIRSAVERFFSHRHQITAPETLDGGDICEAGNHFFIGISHRTNEEGARQLASILHAEGHTTSTVDIRAMTNILHLKSGIAFLDGGHLVVMEEMASRPEFSASVLPKVELIRVSPEESYAANCVQVNQHVLIPAGFPRLQKDLAGRGYKIIPLEMSEFRKMDGGLSCLSLRF